MALGMPSNVQDKLKDSTEEAKAALEKARLERDNCKDDSQRAALNDAVIQAQSNLNTVKAVQKEATKNSNKASALNDFKLPKNQNELITTDKLSQANNKLKGSPVKDISDPDYDPNAEEKKSERPGLSSTFYRDLTAHLHNKPTGNQLDAVATTAKAQGQNYQNRASNRQMEAQASQQIANRNEFAESGKIASMQNDAQNRQNIVNKEGLSGSAAALQRKTTAPDVQTQAARQDQQRNIANQRREEADRAQEEATAAFGDAEQSKLDSRDFDNKTDTTNRLSMGNTLGEESDTDTEQDSESDSDTDQGTDQGTNPDPDTDTDTDTDQVPSTPEVPGTNQTPKKSGTPKEPSVPVDPSAAYQDSARAQNAEKIKNSKPEKGGRYPTFKTPENWNLMSPKERIQTYKDQGLDIADDSATPNFRIPSGWSLYTPAEQRAEYERQGVKFNANGYVPGVPEGYAQGTDCATPGLHLVGEEGPELVNFNGGEQVIPNNMLNVLSDMRMKWIKEDMDRDGRPSEEDFMWLLHKAGKLKHNDREYDAYNEDDFTDSDDSVLGAYADHIRNYVYNYKPGAEQIDPRNDPNVEHIGPMAQDIEQVNPACVHENEQGIKSVDTGRLAMMNAGAIADLARQMRELADRLSTLEV